MKDGLPNEDRERDHTALRHLCDGWRTALLSFTIGALEATRESNRQRVAALGKQVVRHLTSESL